MVKDAITHHRVRLMMLAGLGRSSRGFANHTFNEVYVGNRWCRLDYNQLGCSSLRVERFGLQAHLYTFNDLSDINSPNLGPALRKGEHSDALPARQSLPPPSRSPSCSGPTAMYQSAFHSGLLAGPEAEHFPLHSVERPGGAGVLLNLVAGGTGNRTIRTHEKEYYENLFDGLWLTRPQDILVLLFSLDVRARPRRL